MIGLQAGYATETTIKVLVVSDTADDVTVICNGASYQVAVEATGADRIPGGFVDAGVKLYEPTVDQVCFTGGVTLTGLSSLTEYSVTAEGTSISAKTAPTEHDDFSVFVGTCISTDGQSAPNSGDLTGMFALIKSHAENPEMLPVVAYVNIDDNLYVDRIHAIPGSPLACNYTSNIGPISHSTLFSGVDIPVDAAEWNYAIGWLHIYPGFLPDGAVGETLQATDRAWCYKNINMIPQWGDHEFWNDVGFITANGDAPSFPTEFGRAKGAYDKFMGRLQPPLLDSDNGNAWAGNLGPLQIVALDRVTNAVDCEDGDGPCFGASQVSDVLTAIGNDTSPFKIIGMPVGIRSMDPTALPADSSQSGGAITGPQQSLWNMGTGSKAEYDSMFTDAGGLIALSNSNNFAFCTIHGDWHNGCVIRNQNTLGTNNEDYLSFYAGTMTGSQNVLWDDTYAVGDTQDGSTFDWVKGTVPTAGNVNASWVTKIDVYGSQSPKQMRVSIFEETDLTKPKYSAWYREGQSGNLPVIPNLGLANTGVEE